MLSFALPWTNCCMPLHPTLVRHAHYVMSIPPTFASRSLHRLYTVRSKLWSLLHQLRRHILLSK